ncbi:IS91 family transposase, partial [Colwellia sp. MT2012]|uniref:IS91 family transposase n=1 Tax=Colwellia sp. MT2012 TaxID=1718921 RepID=UPI000A785E3F
MIELATIAKGYQDQLVSQYGHTMQAVHHRALRQIISCHTPQAGAMLYHCDNCGANSTLYPSCGHRHCPACQHQANSNWLNLQRQKLLPVDYYLVTFTLPYQLRHFVWTHQKWAYQAMFEAAKHTLDAFFKRDKRLGDVNGLLAVLHTHSRQLKFHPHLHFVVPAGGVDKKHKCWKKKTGTYLFNANNLAKVFRGKFIEKMCNAHYYLPS